MERMIRELDAIEDDADTIKGELLSGVFALEAELPPVDVMFLYRAIDWISDLGDIAHRVGGLLQRLIAR